MSNVNFSDKSRFIEDGIGVKIIRPGKGQIFPPSSIECTAVEAVRQILLQLYGLADLGFAEGKIDRIRREAIFFLYEGGDAAKWDLKRPHSSAARHLREQTAGKAALPLSVRKAITYDHAIPLRCLRAGLREASDTHEAMRAFLARHVKGVVITREEDDRLTKLGLRSKMPGGTDADDVMSRYRSAEIGFNPADEHALRVS